MNTRANAKKQGKATVISDVLWVSSFLVSWAMLVALWNTWWAVLFMAMFVGHLAGLSEFVHQAVHLNLFGRNRRWNRALGTAAAALLRSDFDEYRDFHLGHHRYVNTLDDPERAIYKNPAYLKIAAGWRELSLREKLVRTVVLARHVYAALGSFGGQLPFVRAVRYGVPIAIALIGLLEGLALHMILVKLIVCWYLPLLLLLFADIVFALSEHYGSKDIEISGERGIVPLEVQYELSWNIKVPGVVEFFLLKRNMHAEHHLVPSIHWTQVRERGRMLPFGSYLRMLWTQGPRT